MNITEFKQAMASLVGRDPTYFTDNIDGTAGPDKLIIAIKNAKAFIQRQIDFEYSRVMVDLTYYKQLGPQEGSSLNAAVYHDTGTPVKIKKVVNAYTPWHW